MSMQLARQYYDVPAKRGMRVRYFGDGRSEPKFGTIISAPRSDRLRIRFDGETVTHLFHPTWGLEYLKGKTA